MIGWLESLLRRFVWRLGRRLYRDARGESDNHILTNGESFVQKCVAHATAKYELSPLTVLDVGANVGIWTSGLIPFLSEEQQNYLCSWCFEPVPETFSLLQQNMKSLKCGLEPQVMQIAFSDDHGEAQMVVMQKFGGTNSLEYDQTMSSLAEDIIFVRKTTLGSFCNEKGIDRIHLVKIDTEGHDRFVLQGAIDLFKAGKIDVAQFEYNHRWVYSRSFLKDIFDLLDGLPYSIARIRPNRLEILSEWHPELERFFEANYAIVHHSVLDWFPVMNGRFDSSNTYSA
jgi:FkbM family methyltransferase